MRKSCDWLVNAEKTQNTKMHSKYFAKNLKILAENFFRGKQKKIESSTDTLYHLHIQKYLQISAEIQNFKHNSLLHSKTRIHFPQVPSLPSSAFQITLYVSLQPRVIRSLR